MTSTEQIVKAATELGKLIAEHDAAKKFDEMTKKIRDDTEAQRLLTDYSRHMQAIQEKQAAGEPIEVEDKRKLEKFQQDMAAHSLLRDLQIIQMDYLDLMRCVEEAMQAPRAGESPEAASSLAGSSVQS